LPTYAYRCESCGNQYEKRESFSAPARQKCPACGKPAQRVLFAPPIVFKGSGFYKTDNRGSSSDDSFKPSTPAAASDDAPSMAPDGHTHGPGGHTHPHDATPAAPASTDTATEGAAAG
jgi:putative FmdB family regulatory protein